MDKMDDFQQVVYARLQAMPNDFVIAAGGFGEVSKTEAMQHVKDNDEIGQYIITINREFFEAIKRGALYEDID